jgi:hypothetical protein
MQAALPRDAGFNRDFVLGSTPGTQRTAQRITAGLPIGSRGLFDRQVRGVIGQQIQIFLGDEA